MNNNDMAHTIADLSSAISLIRIVLQGLSRDEESEARIANRLEAAFKMLSSANTKRDLADLSIVISASKREINNIAIGHYVASEQLDAAIKKLTAIKDCFGSIEREQHEQQ